MTDAEKQRLHKFYPTIPDEELETVQANLDAYLEVAWEIFEESRGNTVEEAPKAKKPLKRLVDSIQRKFDSSQGLPEHPDK